MDLRKTKRKRPEHEENGDDMHFRLSFPKERSITDEDSFYSCNSSDDSSCNQESETQPRSFLEGTEPCDYINIELNSTNPDIMPQEVVVYGYENASFGQKSRRPDKTVQPQFLNSNMSKLTISPQRTFTQSISTESSHTEYGSIQNLEIPVSSNSIAQSGNNLVDSFIDLTSFRMTRLPPCTQTAGHKIDEISRYVLTPNLQPGYISNLQFNMRPNTRNFSTINSILPKEVSNFTYKNPKSPSSSATSPILNLDNDEVSSSPEPDLVSDPLNKYLCRTCGIRFRLRTPYLTHLRTHILLDTLICEICNKQLSNQSEIRNHISKHAKVDTFFCEYCSMVFSDFRFLETHMIRRIEGVTYDCPSCPMNFCSKIGHQLHLQSHRKILKKMSKRGSYSAKKKLRTRYELCKSEVVKTSQARLVKQPKITMSVPLSDIEKPEPSHKSPSKDTSDQEVYCCPFCSQNFEMESQLAQHVSDHKSQSEYTCAHCNSVFSDGETFKTHTLNCKSALIEENTESSDNNAPKAFFCGECNTCFKYQGSLRHHTDKEICHNRYYLRKMKSRRIRNTCPNCLMFYNSRLRLVKHIAQGSCRKINEPDRVEPLTKPVEPSDKPDRVELLSNPLESDKPDIAEPLAKPDKIEPLKGLFVCPDCDRTYKTKRSRRQHICHRTNRKTDSVIVTKPERKHKNVKTHRVTRLKKPTQKFKAKPPKSSNEEHECTNSASIFPTNEKLINHEQNDRLAGVPIEYAVAHKVYYFCPNCTARFPSKELLEVHFRGFCSGRPSKKYIPLSKRSLLGQQRHQQRKQQQQRDILDDKPSRFFCDICGESFKHLSSLQKHVMNRTCLTSPLQKNNSLDKYKAQLTEYLPYTCKVCKISLASKIGLLKHKRRNCCQIFDSNSLEFVVEREIHMFGVRDQYIESSPANSNNTNQSTELTTEVKKEVKEDYSCVYCNERFSDVSLFKSHIEVGMCMLRSTLFDGWKVCSGCKKLFYNTTNMRRHLKSSCKFFQKNS